MKSSARALVTVAALATAGGGSLFGLLRWQAGRLRAAYDLDARRRVPELAHLVDPHADHSVPLGDPKDTEHLPALAVLGDSWLAGLSVGRRRKTPAVLMARGLASLVRSPVRVRALAQPSARAEDIGAQVDALLADPRMRKGRSGTSAVRYAVLSMGSADIVHPFTGSIGLPVLTSALNRLEREGYRVFVLTCPNLGALPGVPRPLRTALRRSSRVLAGSQWLTTVSCGHVPLSTNETMSGTSRVGLVSRAGRYPSPLGYQFLAAFLVRRFAEDLDLPLLTSRNVDAPRDDVDRNAAEASDAASTPETGQVPDSGPGSAAPAPSTAQPRPPHQEHPTP